MSHATLLAALLPPASYSPTAPRVAGELQADANALDEAQASARRLLDAVTPFGAGDLIGDWERVLGVTPSAGASYQERIEAAVAKLAQVGGLSIPYFTELAKRLGYDIEIVEPQPFRAGTSRAGDRIWTPDVIWAWQVVVRGSNVRAYQFRAGISRAGDRLVSFGDPVIEAVFNDLKPAFTFVYFSYQGA